MFILKSKYDELNKKLEKMTADKNYWQDSSVKLLKSRQCDHFQISELKNQLNKLRSASCDYHFEIQKAAQYYVFYVVAGNHKTVAESSGIYSNKAECMAAIRRFVKKLGSNSNPTIIDKTLI